MAYRIGPEQGRTLWEGLRIADGVAKLARRRKIKVKLSSGGDGLDSHWLLRHPNASEMLDRDQLKELWYEVMHLDAALEGFVPIIKRPQWDGITPGEYGKLHDPWGRFNVVRMQNLAIDVLLEDHFSGNSLPVVFIEYFHGSAGRTDELIYFKPYDYLEDKDLPFIKRFYEIAFRSRPRVYRVPLSMEEVAITHKALDRLAVA